MARLLVFVLCASMVTTQRNGNAVKNGGESRGSAELKDFFRCCYLLQGARPRPVSGSATYDILCSQGRKQLTNFKRFRGSLNTWAGF